MFGLLKLKSGGTSCFHSLLPPPAGLSGPSLSLVKGDEKAANWLGKLGAAKSLLVDQSDRCRPNAEELAAAYVYLQVGRGKGKGRGEGPGGQALVCTR